MLAVSSGQRADRAPLDGGDHLRAHENPLSIPDITDRMLSERLQELEQEGIVERTVIPDTPVRVEYALSTKGRALASTIDAISAWAERWITLQVPAARSQARRRK